MKKSIGEAVADKWGVPKETIMNIPKLSMAGNRELYVENYRGILEYTEEVVRLKTDQYIIRITGVELKISHIGKDDVLVEGYFSGISFAN